MGKFTILPLLGRQSAYPADSHKNFVYPNPENMNLAYTYAVGGHNFSLTRTKFACVKSLGNTEWSNSAAGSTRTQGLFELYDGTNTNHIIVTNGNVFIYDSSRDPDEKEDAGTTAFNTSTSQLYTFIRVGAYLAFTDYGSHTPYKWKHGEANLSKLIQSGTEYKFRYIVPFSRRVFGLYSDQTDGDIDIRYSTAWPDTAITSLNYPAANQIWVPNDDPIRGGATMGMDRLFLYSENSIQQVVYFADYTTPFKIYTVVPRGAGCAGHHSIVNMGDRHFVYHTNYGFCEYRGGNKFPYRVISEPIEDIVGQINPDYANLISGVYLESERKVVWAVPAWGSKTNNLEIYYNIDTKQWETFDADTAFLDFWAYRSDYDWNDLVLDYGTGAKWSNLGGSIWAEFAGLSNTLVRGDSSGNVYCRAGESDDVNDSYAAYREEPVMDFGNPRRKDMITEIWFSLSEYIEDAPITVLHRSADTVADIERQGWSTVGTINQTDNTEPKININVNAGRLNQISWGTTSDNTKYSVTKITLKYETQDEY